jgi:hypothetical protein
VNLTRKLLHPTTLVLVAADLVPLLGIFWDWDAFVLLALYWMETAVIGFWTIMAIAVAPHETIGPKMQQTSRLFLIPFFVVHAGLFMSVHFIFLWELFAGAWAQRVHGPREFLHVIVIGTGLWLPLLALFISRGFSFLLTTVGVPFLPAWLSSAPEKMTINDDNPLSEKRLLGGLYARIFVMHLTLMFGGYFALALGTTGALVLLVALKTAVDVKQHLKNDFRGEPRRQTA